MIDEKKSLFLIGNGFDCYGHGMKTKYADFRNYLVGKYPDNNYNYTGLLESRLMPDGGERYEQDELVGSIIRTLDECEGEEWCDLERCLGDTFIDAIACENEWAYEEIGDISDDNNNIFRSVYENEELSKNITGAYVLIEELFRQLVFEKLSGIEYDYTPRMDKKPDFNKALFLSFNYTATLEKIYGVSEEDICHIHGYSLEPTSKILFGHGDDSGFTGYHQYWGIAEAYNRLKRSLRKDTQTALLNNMNFFNRIAGIKNVYSFGFSFSDVDMLYVEEICNQLNPNKVIWNFNKYDWKYNRENVDKISQMGFCVCECNTW